MLPFMVFAWAVSLPIVSAVRPMARSNERWDGALVVGARPATLCAQAGTNACMPVARPMADVAWINFLRDIILILLKCLQNRRWSSSGVTVISSKVVIIQTVFVERCYSFCSINDHDVLAFVAKRCCSGP